MRDFKTLNVWQHAHQLALDAYRATQDFPREERYGLTDQIRRASVSIPSNIAEGCGREGDAELRRFLYIAMGSASEVEYQLLLARDLGYLEEDAHASLEAALLSTKRMLNSFIQKLTHE